LRVSSPLAAEIPAPVSATTRGPPRSAARRSSTDHATRPVAGATTAPAGSGSNSGVAQAFHGSAADTSTSDDRAAGTDGGTPAADDRAAPPSSPGRSDGDAPSPGRADGSDRPAAPLPGSAAPLARACRSVRSPVHTPAGAAHAAAKWARAVVGCPSCVSATPRAACAAASRGSAARARR
jgi:hypothetical protein